MKTLVSCLALLFVSHLANAQKPPIKFGQIPIEDLQMTTYERDSSAVAVILADYGESSLVYAQNDGFSLNFDRITRIKILKKDGLEWGNFTINLYKDGTASEDIVGLKAVTYNLEDGKIVETKLKNDGIFKEVYSENLNLVKVTLPNVKEGSVVEITYKINSDFVFNFQDWQFQYTIPVIWSEYKARIPEFFNYDKYMQGYVPLHINEEKSASGSITLSSFERTDGRVTRSIHSSETVNFIEYLHRWVSKDIPAFKIEPFMTTYRDYISKINFELAYTKFPNQPVKPVMGSWEEINKRYSENANFMGMITGGSFLKKIVEDITTGRTTDEEKILAIDNYVKNNISWNGSSQKYTDAALKQIFEDKKGNSAEINLLLASMLEKAGVNVSPVLISTRDHGFVRENTPISSQFNYVICLVQTVTKKILLDGTDKLLPTGTLPERCLNGNGFVVSKNGHHWVPLSAPAKSRTFVNVDLSISPEGEIKGKINLGRSGYYAQHARRKFLSNGKPDYIKEFNGGHSWQISNSEFINEKEIAEPFKESHEMQINDHAIVSGDMVYLNPFLLLKEEENPFKIEKREYPVDFGSPIEKLYMCKLKIPEGYTVDEIPQSRIFLLPENSARYLYNVSQAGDIINITSSFQINRHLFSQEEYPNLREFYNQVIAKQEEQIVLKKK